MPALRHLTVSTVSKTALFGVFHYFTKSSTFRVITGHQFLSKSTTMLTMTTFSAFLTPFDTTFLTTEKHEKSMKFTTQRHKRIISEIETFLRKWPKSVFFTIFMKNGQKVSFSGSHFWPVCDKKQGAWIPLLRFRKWPLLWTPKKPENHRFWGKSVFFCQKVWANQQGGDSFVSFVQTPVWE